MVIFLFHLIPVRKEYKYLTVTKGCQIEGRVCDIKSDGTDLKSIVLDRICIVRGSPVYDNDKLLIYDQSDTNIKIGNLVSIAGMADPFRRAGNPGQFDEYTYYRGKGYAYRVFSENIFITDDHVSFKEYLRSFKSKGIKILYNNLSQHDADIAGAMLFGEKKLMSVEDKELYSLNGIMHIMAVSGLHVSMISMILLWIISKFPINYYVGRVTVVLLLISYGFIAGFSVSCFRAVIMIMLQIFAKITGRSYDPLSALSLAGIITLLINSGSLFECDFLLSYMAVISLVFSERVLMFAIKAEHMMKDVLKSICSGVSLMLFVSPVILYFYYELPVYSVLVNLLIIPVVSLLFTSTFLCVAAGMLIPKAAVIFAGSIHVIIRYFDIVMKLFQKYMADFRLTGHIGVTSFIVYYMVLILAAVLIYVQKNRVKKALMIVLMPLSLVVFTIHIPMPENEMKISVLDVGQGDGIFIDMPNGINLMIDGGSSDVRDLAKYRLEPFLKYNGVRRIDYWFVSHMDSDHYIGMIEILKRREINRIRIDHLVLPDVDICRKKLAAIIAQYDIELPDVIYIDQYDTAVFDDVKLLCLSPKCGVSYSGQNDASEVLSLTFVQFNMLFTGDIEERTEKDINIKSDIRYEFIKVAHHGSDSSSTDYILDDLICDNAVISYGKNNRYGHPSVKVIKRLRDKKMNIYETAKNGAILIKTDGTAYTVKTFLK